jgi:cobalt-precorrin-5B (C1)-methyltransferase
MKRYKLYNGKKLRYGYTTGTTAAAATKAAAIYIETGQILDCVEIETPKGWTVSVPINYVKRVEGSKVIAEAVKDSGDDPDVTNRIEIKAVVEINEEETVNIVGGTGVGIITKKGLQTPVGSYAINPVPLQMIEKSFREVFKSPVGANICIEVPKGKEIARKTLNSKLGIVGGISIIGTTGIVEPMSETALVESLHLEIKSASKESKRLVMVLGNYGENFTKVYNEIKAPRIKISNFIGDCIDFAKAEGIEEILLIGHIGKLIKVAGGIFNTHSKVADGRMEILGANYMYFCENRDIFMKIMDSNTTDEAVEIIKSVESDFVFDKIAQKIKQKCEARAREEISVETILFNLPFGELGCSDFAHQRLSKWTNGEEFYD